MCFGEVKSNNRKQRNRVKRHEVNFWLLGSLKSSLCVGNNPALKGRSDKNVEITNSKKCMYNKFSPCRKGERDET